VRVSKKKPFDEIPEIAQAIAAAEAKIGSKGRVFVRYSGTESLARVMVEGEDLSMIQTLAQDIAKKIEKHLR